MLRTMTTELSRGRGTRSRLARGGLLGALVVALGASPVDNSLITAGIGMSEETYLIGQLPTVTFTVTSSFVPGKVSLFVYTSDEPNAFTTSQFPPQFVGDLSIPGAITTTLFRPPEKSAVITKASTEKYVQGAVFDIQGSLAAITNEAFLDIEYPIPPVFFALNMQEEDDFATPLVNGQDITTPPEFGKLFAVSAAGPNLGAAIFDSDPAGPNAGGPAGSLLVNSGNLLLLQDPAYPDQTVPGIFDTPSNSPDGGTLILDFVLHVEPLSVTLSDLCSIGPVADVATVKLIDVLGATRTYRVPSCWTNNVAVHGPPGYGKLDLTTLAPQPGFLDTATATEDPGYDPKEIVRMEIFFGGRGAVDDILFNEEQVPHVPMIAPNRSNPPVPKTKHKIR